MPPRGPKAAWSMLLTVSLGTLLPSGLASQVDSAQIQAWYDAGNRNLQQGLYATAEAEFQKVLTAIPPQQRPATLQLVARCRYLQGDLEGTILALQRAALLAPRADTTRQLLIATMENLDRAEQARAWLGRLETEGPAVLAVELGAAVLEDELQYLREVAVAVPAEPAAPHRQGAFRVRFDERSPLSAIEIYLERYSTTPEAILESDPAGGAYDLSTESFEVFVPASYDPQIAFGLIVWISPARSGGVGRPENLELLTQEKLIWIGANDSGNERWHWYRAGLALDAAHNMRKLYNIDPERIYIAGYSGGGRVASSLGLLYPEAFRGGAYFFGCNYFRNVAVPGKPGAYWRAGFPSPPASTLEGLRKRHSFVLVTGQHDFNRDETEAYFAEYRRDRFQNVTYLEIPGADHGFGVQGDWLRRVVEALDQRAAKN